MTGVQTCALPIYYELGLGIDIFSEYFIFSPSVRGVFGLKDELIRDTSVVNSAYTDNMSIPKPNS